MSDDTRLQVQLREALNRAGITQRELAKRMGVTEGRVSHMFNAENNPTWESMSRIAEACGLRLHVRFCHCSEGEGFVCTPCKERAEKLVAASAPRVADEEAIEALEWASNLAETRWAFDRSAESRETWWRYMLSLRGVLSTFLDVTPETDAIDSIREWLASWGDGANWMDASGNSVPIGKAELSRLLDLASTRSRRSSVGVQARDVNGQPNWRMERPSVVDDRIIKEQAANLREWFRLEGVEWGETDEVPPAEEQFIRSVLKAAGLRVLDVDALSQPATPPDGLPATDWRCGSWRSTQPERCHELKTWPEPFAAILSGEKRHEVRKNDRGFKVGDVLHLREWKARPQNFVCKSCLVVMTSYDDFEEFQHAGCGALVVEAEELGYTGRHARVRVTHLTPGGSWGLPADVCVMSIEALP